MMSITAYKNIFIENTRFHAEQKRKKPLTDIWYIHKGFEKNQENKNEVYKDLNRTIQTRCMKIKRFSCGGKLAPIRVSSRLKNLSASVSQKRSLISSSGPKTVKSICKGQIQKQRINTSFKPQISQRVVNLVQKLHSKNKRSQSFKQHEECDANSTPRMRDISSAYNITQESRSNSTEPKFLKGVRNKSKFQNCHTKTQARSKYMNSGIL